MKTSEFFSNTFSYKEASFSSSHYISADELLHGHEYYLTLSLQWIALNNGFNLNPNFIKSLLLEICSTFNQKIMIPEFSIDFPIEDFDDHLRINFQNIHFDFPKRNCIMLPIISTTCEELSKYFSRIILERFYQEFKSNLRIDNLRVTVAELYQQQEGTTGICIKSCN
ncbi:unnamed protein product [Blepharisma stoltei]|uniref:6-pyruvoyltetrahydropterin synthase n=1 Tax=Blepharisma stoltei TaxID=1481888 RepID=A0AAU9J1W8_9CILI|nr:unnamed protein product [Blepharisma stoltei]